MKRRTALALSVVGAAALAGTGGRWLRMAGLHDDPLRSWPALRHGRYVSFPPEPTPFEADIEGYVYAGVSGNYIDDRILALGLYERPELELLRDLLVAHRGSEGVVLDVGANVGQHTLYLARHAAQVHAVEPFPPVLERLDALVERNGLRHVTVHRVGFSNRAGSLPFFAPPAQNLGTGSFDPAFRRANTPDRELPLVVGDDWLAEHGVGRVDLVKVDVEGTERLVLEGLRRTLERDRPTVMFELNPAPGSFRDAAQVERTFPEAYRFFELADSQLYWVHLPRGTYFYGPRLEGGGRLVPFTGRCAKQRNVVAVPEERAPQ